MLDNWRRHGVDRRDHGLPFDRFASASAFLGWTTGAKWRSDDDWPVSAPRTELMRFDWQWYGLIDPYEVPGPLD